MRIVLYPEDYLVVLRFLDAYLIIIVKPRLLLSALEIKLSSGTIDNKNYDNVGWRMFSNRRIFYAWIILFKSSKCRLLLVVIFIQIL